MFHRSSRPKGARVSNVSKEELQLAVSKSNNFTQLVRNLGFSDGDPIRLKIKKLLATMQIDVSHFRSRPSTPDHIKIERQQIRAKKAGIYQKEKRKNPMHRAEMIFTDIKGLDRRRGFKKTDLTLNEIKELISKPCSYCEDTKLLMSLDRINNEIGHNKTNVIQSCIRCNLIRRNMPYKAWLKIASLLKDIREAGLFEDWTGEIHRK